MGTPQQTAINAIEAMVSSFVNKKQYDVLIALQGQGVSLVHSLAAAAYAGRHEQAQWLLDRGVKPDARVLLLAIMKSRQMTARILPYVDRFKPQHADAAAKTGQIDLLERIIATGVLPSRTAYEWIGKYAQGNAHPAVDVLLRKGEPWRIGTRAIQHLIRFMNGQQVEHALRLAPKRYDREKLLAQAIVVANDAAVQEIVHFGFGRKVTPKVALRTLLGELRLNHAGNVYQAVKQLAQWHRETRSEPFSPKVISQLLTKVVRAYMRTFHQGDESNRTSQQYEFLQAVSDVLELCEPGKRVEALKLYEVQFLIDRVESPEARYRGNRRAWPKAYEAFIRFRGEFEGYLQHEQNRLESLSSFEADSPTFGGP